MIVYSRQVVWHESGGNLSAFIFCNVVVFYCLCLQKGDMINEKGCVMSVGLGVLVVVVSADGNSVDFIEH